MPFVLVQETNPDPRGALLHSVAKFDTKCNLTSTIAVGLIKPREGWGIIGQVCGRVVRASRTAVT